MKRGGAVYILTNKSNTVLYIGVTSNLYLRIHQHLQGHFQNSFTSKYNCNKLVYYEDFLTIDEAILRENQLKNWHRAWKINLINGSNPGWVDLLSKIVP